MNHDELLDWLGLRLINGVGSVTFARLVERFGSPGAAMGASVEQIMKLPRMQRDVAEAIHAKDWFDEPERQLERLEQLGGRIVAMGDHDYPPLLANAFAPPPLLYVRGDLNGCRDGGVGIVGSRKASPYGIRMAGSLAAELAQAGVSIISGLAMGVDGAAHRAALDAGGHTVGVLGCGLDIAYPRSHHDLIEEMAGRGAVVSEFPLGSSPVAANFPVRNRVIAGLSKAVVVVEAVMRSGALITARYALEENREVFAVPGLAGAAGSAGCNDLIRRNAAQLVETAADILAPGALPPSPKPLRPAPVEVSAETLLPQERELLGLIGPEPVPIDELIRACSLSPQEASHFLLNLEMAELVRQLPGKRYELV